VAMVSLSGAIPVSRVGASLLRHANLAHLAVTDGEAYVAAAVELAEDVAQLDRIRRTMRQRLRASALMDERGFAVEFARAIRGAYDAASRDKNAKE
jgi:protein O-GlcNAc transferase